MPLALTGLHIAGLNEAIHDAVHAIDRDPKGLGDVRRVPAIPDVQPDHAPAQVSRDAERGPGASRRSTIARLFNFPAFPRPTTCAQPENSVSCCVYDVWGSGGG